MIQIPFFPKFIIYFPIVAGVMIFIFSFSQKQYSAMSKSFGENTANKARWLFRYGGPIMIILGLLQYFIKDL